MTSPSLASVHSYARPRPLFVAVLILVCLALIWFSIGDHPLHGRSEGRYAVVSLNMASGGDWLIPRYGGHPHLTKPPLIYWLEALCIRALGPTELAVRIPSAVAGSLTLLLLLGFAWHAIGSRTAILATALLAIMPQHLVLSRLTLTDPLLTVFWFGTLAGGFLAIAESRLKRLGRVLMWGCVALGLLSKGPLVWVPVGILLLWLGLGGRWKEVRSLRLVWGMGSSRCLPGNAGMGGGDPAVRSRGRAHLVSRDGPPRDRSDGPPQAFLLFHPDFHRGAFPSHGDPESAGAELLLGIRVAVPAARRGGMPLGARGGRAVCDVLVHPGEIVELPPAARPAAGDPLRDDAGSLAHGSKR